MKFDPPLLLMASAIAATMSIVDSWPNTPAESAEIDRVEKFANERGSTIEYTGFKLDDLEKRAIELKAANAALRKRIEGLEAESAQ